MTRLLRIDDTVIEEVDGIKFLVFTLTIISLGKHTLTTYKNLTCILVFSLYGICPGNKCLQNSLH